jgi:hypothetical protein
MRRRVLLVSTDPASNLDEMLGTSLSLHATAIQGVERLSALDIDPEKAADEYRERVIAPYRAIWTEAQIAELQEQLAGACTVGDRGVRRVRRDPGGRREERAVRPRAVRYGAHRTHAEASQPAACVVGLPAVDHLWRLVPRAALGAHFLTETGGRYIVILR